MREAVVLAREDAPGEKRLVAYVVAQPESDPTPTSCVAFSRQKLPEYMVPAVFVLLDALPLMPNGKVDRRALPAPDRSRPELEKAFVAPRDDLELQLAHIWEEVLGVRPVGVTDNFFELGGHSLLAVRLFALIEKRLGKKLPLTAVFQGATVEHLAGVLRQQATAGPQSIVGGLFNPVAANGRSSWYIRPADTFFPTFIWRSFWAPINPAMGCKHRGLEEGQDPHTRIEDMAAYYIEALQTVQPTGPYLLGGWSMGGVVAFEMAQQLHAQGQRVALLALLDGRIPTPDESLPEEDFEAILLRFCTLFRYFVWIRWRSFARLPKTNSWPLCWSRRRAPAWCPRISMFPRRSRFVELLRNDLRATQNYGLHRYPGRITFFKAIEELAGTSADPTLGWSEWAQEEWRSMSFRAITPI